MRPLRLRGEAPGTDNDGGPRRHDQRKGIHLNGNSHSLRVHYADRPNTIVDAERYISRIPTRDMTGIVYPDLLLAFDAGPGVLERANS